MEINKYKIGRAYRLKRDGAYYWATLISIDKQVRPPRANVIIREHSVDSFNGLSRVRRRHTKHSEVVPILTVLLKKLKP
jgi:hypothetical protein